MLRPGKSMDRADDAVIKEKLLPGEERERPGDSLELSVLGALTGGDDDDDDDDDDDGGGGGGSPARVPQPHSGHSDVWCSPGPRQFRAGRGASPPCADELPAPAHTCAGT